MFGLFIIQKVRYSKTHISNISYIEQNLLVRWGSLYPSYTVYIYIRIVAEDAQSAQCSWMLQSVYINL